MQGTRQNTIEKHTPSRMGTRFIGGRLSALAAPTVNPLPSRRLPEGLGLANDWSCLADVELAPLRGPTVRECPTSNIASYFACSMRGVGGLGEYHVQHLAV